MRGRQAAKRIAQSLIQTILLLIGVTLITFLILYLSPGNPAQRWLVGGDGHAGMVSEEAIREQEEKMGLDRPFLVQYKDWLLRAARGDLGNSMITGKPVLEELKDKAVPTVELTAVSLLFTILISVPLGICCAVHKDGWLDNIVRFFSFLGISVPSFLISLLLLWFFCLKLRWFSVIAAEGWRGMVLPAGVFVIQCSSKFTRQVRAVVIEQLGREYVKGAAARGVKKRTILFSHVLKNCMIPILSWCGIYLGVMLGGAAVIENIFSWNGLGKMAVEAVTAQDYYLIQGFVLWTAVIFLAVNFVIDLLSALIDPRIRKNQEESR